MLEFGKSRIHLRYVTNSELHKIYIFHSLAMYLRHAFACVKRDSIWSTVEVTQLCMEFTEVYACVFCSCALTKHHAMKAY
jgi:hypothetical protein